MHHQGIVLNLFGSVRPERREGQRSKGRIASSRFVSLRFRFASLRLVSFSPRLVSFSFSFRFRFALLRLVSFSFRIASFSFRRKEGRKEGRKEEEGRRGEAGRTEPNRFKKAL